MGINDLEIEKLKCVSKILYYADSDDTFAEYELDYIIFAKTDVKQFQHNQDEVKAIKWVDIDGLDKFLDVRREQHGEDITPWFRMLKENKLKDWWQTLIGNDVFPNEQDHIERFID